MSLLRSPRCPFPKGPRCIVVFSGSQCPSALRPAVGSPSGFCPEVHRLPACKWKPCSPSLSPLRSGMITKPWFVSLALMVPIDSPMPSELMLWMVTSIVPAWVWSGISRIMQRVRSAPSSAMSGFIDEIIVSWLGLSATSDGFSCPFQSALPLCCVTRYGMCAMISMCFLLILR